MHLTIATPPISIDMLVQFNAAWNRHDIVALMGFMDVDCEFHGVAGPDLLGRSYIGLDAVKEGFMLAWQNFPDAQWVDGNHFIQGDRGVSECTFKGTRADGLRVEARMVDVFTFKNCKISIKNAYRKDRPAFKLCSFAEHLLQ
jgi:ketosteroid isomerase-like protein